MCFTRQLFKRPTGIVDLLLRNSVLLVSVKKIAEDIHFFCPFCDLAGCTQYGPKRIRPILARGVGGPASSEEAAKRCTELNWTVGPTLITVVGGPASSKEAAFEIVELALSLAKTQASGTLQHDVTLAGVLLQIIEKAPLIGQKRPLIEFNSEPRRSVL
jgi:hypothetical protein